MLWSHNLWIHDLKIYCSMWRGSKTDRFITSYKRVDPEIVAPEHIDNSSVKTFDNHKLINLSSPKRDWYRKGKGKGGWTNLDPLFPIM
jgi:hypothetical protein